MKRQRASLGELCKLVKGTSPISKTLPGPYPLVTTGELHKTADSFQLDAEAVCIPLISSTGHGHASLKRVHYQSGKFAIANLLAAALVKDPSVLSPKFLTRYLNFTKDRLIVPLMTGAANMSISVDRLATVPVEFPPLAEQERSVKLLDEADELRKLRAQADHRTSALIPALFDEMFGDPVSNPKGWPRNVLAEVCDGKSGIKAGPFGSSLKKDSYTTEGPRVYGQEQVIAGDFSVGDYHISEAKFIEMSAYAVKPGDLLISLVGTIGKVLIVPEGIERGIINPRLLRVRPRLSVLHPCYLEHILTSQAIISFFAGIANGVTMGVLNGGMLKKLEIPLPPLAQQKEFAARVTEIRAVQAEQASSRLRLENLFQSMLHRAFNGDL